MTSDKLTAWHIAQSLNGSTHLNVPVEFHDGDIRRRIHSLTFAEVDGVPTLVFKSEDSE